jgi:hypothetical protein
MHIVSLYFLSKKLSTPVQPLGQTISINTHHQRQRFSCFFLYHFHYVGRVGGMSILLKSNTEALEIKKLESDDNAYGIMSPA